MFGGRNWFQMIGVDAESDSTQVVELQPFWNRADQ
jgi:hypothetical protein